MRTAGGQALYPSTELHEAALVAKSEADWVQEICREQRRAVAAASGVFAPRQYSTHAELQREAFAFVERGRPPP